MPFIYFHIVSFVSFGYQLQHQMIRIESLLLEAERVSGLVSYISSTFMVLIKAVVKEWFCIQLYLLIVISWLLTNYVIVLYLFYVPIVLPHNCRIYQ